MSRTRYFRLIRRDIKPEWLQHALTINQYMQKYNYSYPAVFKRINRGKIIAFRWGRRGLLIVDPEILNLV